MAGAVDGARELGIKVSLVGDPHAIEEELDKADAYDLPVSLIPASEVIHFDENPVKAVRSKPDSSINVTCRLVADGLDSVRIAGQATNKMPFKVKNPIVTGVLLDGDERMVSLGYTYVLVEDIEPGASVRFDLRVSGVAYADYRVYAQSERDWQ